MSDFWWPRWESNPHLFEWCSIVELFARCPSRQDPQRTLFDFIMPLQSLHNPVGVRFGDNLLLLETAHEREQYLALLVFFEHVKQFILNILYQKIGIPGQTRTGINPLTEIVLGGRPATGTYNSSGPRGVQEDVALSN